MRAIVYSEKGPLHHYPLAETTAAYDAVQPGTVGAVLIDAGQPTEKVR